MSARREIDIMDRNSSMYRALRWGYQPFKRARNALSELVSLPQRRAIIDNYLSSPGFKGLQIGSGPNLLQGWLNSDVAGFGRPEIIIDITRKLPFPDGSLDAIYGSEVIEHIPRESALRFLIEGRRVLRPDGVLRLTTPDLAEVFKIGLGLNEQSTIQMHATTWLEDDKELTPDIWVNAMFRRWGHEHLWDFPSIKRAIHGAGFDRVERVEPQVTKSIHPELAGIDTRYGMPPPPHCWHSSMIIEAYY
jgi:predicted SAM-dependent methyltransferase